jgi:hypothetical protein
MQVTLGTIAKGHEIAMDMFSGFAKALPAELDFEC